MLYRGRRAATSIRDRPAYPFDVSADGQRFVLLKSERADRVANRIDVVLDWPAELDRLAPAGKK